MVSEKAAGKRVLEDAIHYSGSPEWQKSLRDVGQWMQGRPVDRPSKRDFDRAYSASVEDLPDSVSAQVEKAAIRAGTEESQGEVREPLTEKTDFGRWEYRGAITHAHPHKKGHHGGPETSVDATGRTPHHHKEGSRAHGGWNGRP